MSNVFKDKLLGAVVGASLIGAVIFAETAFSAVPVLEGADFEGAEVVEFESVFYTYPPSPFKAKPAEKLGKELELITEPSCLIPGLDGAILSREWKDALWDKFFTAAPQRQRRCVEQYKIVKRA